ncbi:uncharacterized protein YecT (DUF1311 family) [Loktanella ponticola]|uniref:Uncharacterized protein YecT (DUF1311 family) n=1 Tax=Yoonia ponticola TaxID=1524255 RepID=A0A7W9BKU5_9RHOB|nr:lysozyme inhibitor LprI family protein [Yoonia ponticola]MBB5722191.1 uncharacterized protein YecT (DUF1311 family) [Yoonia ponticola]
MIATPILAEGSYDVYDLVPEPAALQDYEPDILLNCLRNSGSRGSRQACIGVSSGACMRAEASNHAMAYTACTGAEWGDWDARLNSTYADLVHYQTYGDRDEMAVEKLREMQRAWITFRDAACEWDSVAWGGMLGVGAGPAVADCMMVLTAQQTLFLMERARMERERAERRIRERAAQ